MVLRFRFSSIEWVQYNLDTIFNTHPGVTTNTLIFFLPPIAALMPFFFVAAITAVSELCMVSAVNPSVESNGGFKITHLLYGEEVKYMLVLHQHRFKQKEGKRAPKKTNCIVLAQDLKKKEKKLTYLPTYLP